MEMKSDDGAMRVRTKDCNVCNDAKEVRYRCRYNDQEEYGEIGVVQGVPEGNQEL